MTNTINSKKRKSSISQSNASDGTTTTNKNKSKKPRVSVKEEFNVEIPSDVSVISTISSSETSSSLVLSQGKGLLPPISSLLLYKPNIAANRFDPFYQSIDPYVQYTIPGPMPKAYTTPAFKHETDANATTTTTVPPAMPIIPYYFHHAHFGIETCMHQLEHHRQQQAVKAYPFKSANDGANYYYHI